MFEVGRNDLGASLGSVALVGGGEGFVDTLLISWNHRHISSLSTPPRSGDPHLLLFSRLM